MKQGVRRGLTAVVGALACVTLVGCASTPDGPMSAEEYARERSQRLMEAQRLAERAERAEDAPEAEELLREAVRLFPQHSAYWTNLGTALARQDDFGGAAEAFGVAADLDPTDPRPMYNLGAVWAKRYYPREAADHFRQAIERDPNYLNALRGFVKARSDLRDFDRELLELVDRAIILEINDEWRRYFQRQRNVILAALGEAPAGTDDHEGSR